MPRATFVVTMQGVNIQGVFGPFKQEIIARIYAQQRATNDVDDYHTWDVRALTLDGLGEPSVSYQKNGRRIEYDARKEARERRRAENGVPAIVDVLDPDYQSSL